MLHYTILYYTIAYYTTIYAQVLVRDYVANNPGDNELARAGLPRRIGQAVV